MAHHLGPSVSLDRGASRFVVGEYILVRIPERIQVEGYVDNEATAVGTNISPASTGSGPQHFAFIRDVHLLPGRSWVLEVYPVLSFTGTGGALPTYTTKAALLPLSSRHPTPGAFGEPLDFGNWSTDKDLFLHVFPRWFTMTSKRSFKRMNPPLIMDLEDLYRIDSYREYLLSTTSPQNHDGQSHPLPNGGSGDEQGSSNPSHGQTGDEGGPAASGVTSVTSWGATKAAGPGLEKISVKSTHGLLALEDVDEDAEDADATTLDELMMLTYDGDPTWMEELRRYLQEKEEEKERMQNERAVRLAHWREDISV
ncbi:hypothetical protein M378DRAFT_77473 [Amanita muscaria Koide BX008]|uniref:Uncharacterized protein n=1 Tax=Amanita muscaria (strain Koide BX008) TaxID=946122 RepID=A0A0C2TDQ6_AMAMK|nr:hypothetical protein M378DRAFT_77473 [Amanita muscaria Koide BX008]